MSGKRDSLFPATSIGRSPSPTRTASVESLAAHPLLSSTPSYTNTPNDTASGGISASGIPGSPRYVPYTPRHRTAPAPTAASSAGAGAAVAAQPSVVSAVSASPQQAVGDARSRLQLVSLRGAAAAAGLEPASVGWALLERLAEGEHGPEWAPIWDALVAEKATLLLPSESAHGHDAITVDVVKDHIILCNGPSRDDAPMVTMSGLRGQLSGDALVFRSSLRPETQTFRSVLSATTRSSTLAALPPLPLMPASPSVAYPTFTVSKYAPTLPLQPRHTKPPLPPRPGAKGATAPTAHSRLPNPFSFFGKAATTASTASASTSVAEALGELEPAIDVPAFIVDRRVTLKDVGRQLHKALRTEAKDAMAGAGVPSSVMDRTLTFLNAWAPVVKGPKKPGDGAGGLMSSNFVLNAPVDDASAAEQALQDLYAALEEDLRATGSPVSATLRRRTHEGDEEKERERVARRQMDLEARIRDVLEVIERVICTLLYDQFFSPPNEHDASHDEALLSRVAALNETDIGLDHLGVDVGKATFEVETVVTACGQMLASLPACRSPADKSAIIVAAHKVIVDGLSRLPRIRLKSDAEIAGQSTPRSSRLNSATSEGEKVEKIVNPEKLPQTIHAPESEERPPIVRSPDALSSGVDASPLLPAPEVSSVDSVSSLHARTGSPLLTISPPSQREPTPVSSDMLLPLLILAVIKTHPAQFVSHLLYIQRCRNRSFGGEEGFCLVNLLAVADFVENVDLAALGLWPEGEAPRPANLTPIALARAADDPSSPQLPPVPAGLRGRVEQQVDALAGSANKVLSAAVDSSFGMLRAILPAPGIGDGGALTPTPSAEQAAAPWNTMRPAFGLLRRESGFSIASLAASLPGAVTRSRSFREDRERDPLSDAGRPLVEVSSRPASRASSMHAPAESDEEEEEGSGEESEASGDDATDARSIRSFESMMSSRRKAISRKSLSDRLASMPGLSRLAEANKVSGSPPSSRPSSMVSDLVIKKPSPPASRRSSLLPAAQWSSPSKPHSLLPPAPPSASNTPIGSRDASPAPVRLSSAPSEPIPGVETLAVAPPLRLSPPRALFLECAPDGTDLRIADVRELLAEYRRLVAGVREAGGFDE